MSVTIKSKPTTNSADFDPMFSDRSDHPETEFSSEYFREMLLSYIFGPSEVKYYILRENRRNKLHAVIAYFLTYGMTGYVINGRLDFDQRR